MNNRMIKVLFLIPIMFFASNAAIANDSLSATKKLQNHLQSLSSFTENMESAQDPASKRNMLNQQQQAIEKAAGFLQSSRQERIDSYHACEEEESLKNDDEVSGCGEEASNMDLMLTIIEQLIMRQKWMVQ